MREVGLGVGGVWMWMRDGSGYMDGALDMSLAVGTFVGPRTALLFRGRQTVGLEFASSALAVELRHRTAPGRWIGAGPALYTAASFDGGGPRTAGFALALRYVLDWSGGYTLAWDLMIVPPLFIDPSDARQPRWVGTWGFEVLVR